MTARAIVMAAAWLLAPTAFAAELRSLTFDKEDGVYKATTEIWLDADPARVYEVLSDWDLSEQFTSLITESRDLPPDDSGRPGYYMRIKGCVLFFCKSFEREGWVERQPITVIRAIADPERSDFEISDETWTFEGADGGTRVFYEMQMKPDFWVPPLIGPYVLKKKIRNSGVEALQRIERYLDDNPPAGE